VVETEEVEALVRRRKLNLKAKFQSRPSQFNFKR